MKTLIITVGTQGDVRPYVALAKGLRAAGYDAELISSASFAGLAAKAGVPFRSVSADFLSLLDTPEGKRVLAGGNPLTMMQKVRPMLRELLDDLWRSAQDAELILHHPKALGGAHIAEKLGVPAIIAHPVPMFSPTAAFPSPIVPAASLGPVLNRLSHRALLAATVAPFKGLVNDWRREALGLPPAREQRPAMTLYGFSEVLLPRPADWDERTVASGFWFLDEAPGYKPPADLEAFLASGPAPIYVGFGSMASEDAAAKGRMVVEALARAGARGVIATGQGGLALAEGAPHILSIAGTPHDWLFPRMAAVAHHGGVGTVAAGLRAGKPSLICPFLVDQPFWGRRVAALGAGPQPIPQKKLSVEGLTAAFRQLLTDDAMQARAAELAARLQAEDGVGRAVDAVGRVVGHVALPVS